MRYDSCQNLLTKNLFLNLSFLCSYIQNSIAVHSCIYFGFSQKQEKNKSMRYDSCQDLAYPKKNSKIWVSCVAIYKIQTCTLLYLSWLLLTSKKTYGVLFLSESAD